MLNFIKKIKMLWVELHMQHIHAHEISPNTIGEMARNLVHLIELIERGTVLKQFKVQSLNNLKEEMLILEQMTENTDFCRLSADRRLALHNSLLKSLDSLLSSAQFDIPSTERLQ